MRRRFDHLAAEVSVAVGRVVPRFPLWLALREQGHDPERLSREGALAFCDGPLAALLGELGLALEARTAARLRRRIARFSADYPTPEEVFARL